MEDIAYFYSENKVTFAVTKQNREFIIDLSLDKLMEQLDPDVFFRSNRQTVVTVSYTHLYGGGWYNGWWGPGYWGPYWNDWYYPYPVTYSYNTGTLIMEMVNLTDHPEDTSQKVKLPVIWHSYATGLLFENSKYNMQLTLDAVNQAFDQSPYIKKS